ncbi:MAG TPA: M1 family metallopeptidase, partial [Longimicrobiaceae bacterium]|nr:M1 family metallopeptidase [Longimicrobiaceae bacterium]
DTHVLHGRERLRYINRSPATLDTLWLHQHLNAFRPNSAWARRELKFGERRFQDLGPDDYAYERFTAPVTVDGQPVHPVYPGAPDSTVVGLPLPAPLHPGDTVTVRMDWDARLSTTPRRQGRNGRHYDFAQWYPRIAVYDQSGWEEHPLLPQGEFYGEFASYDVTLDLPSDQVMGATGVPAEGDPGWQGAAAPGTGDILYQRDFYGTKPAEPLGFLDESAAPGRKRVRWRAAHVQHFAWSTDPEYTYEQGSVARAGTGASPGRIAIHVLYQPGDTAWDEGVTVERSATVLAWEQQKVGPYVWPQFTNLHRFERGGTEFPMMVMDGSASLGLIAHEGSHQWFYGMLANNQWKSSWLDEGFASFMANWFFEDHGETNVWDRTMEGMRRWERAGRSQPVAEPAEDFRDFGTYNVMTYTKTSIVLRMLRAMVGPATMQKILQRYYQENVLHHVTEQDFRRAVREVTGESYDWFFDEWLHTDKTLDYGVTAATTRYDDGQWRTEVQVTRIGDIWMPVTLLVDGVTRTLDSHDRVQTVEITTAEAPTEVVLDPEDVLLDLDPSNNSRQVRQID